MPRLIENLTRLPLAEDGVMLTEEAQQALTEEMLQALRVDVPILRQLRASELVTAVVCEESRLWLVVRLAEALQPSITAAQELRQAFRLELQQARRQIEMVEWRIREALGEGRAPDDGVPDSDEEVTTRAIRLRVRKHVRHGQLLIPGFPIGRLITVGPVPRAMARAPQLTVSAIVVSMTREEAKLERVQIAAWDVDRTAFIPGVRTCNTFTRDLGTNHEPFGEVLRKAMDTRERIELHTLVEIDWATGIALGFRQQP